MLRGQPQDRRGLGVVLLGQLGQAHVPASGVLDHCSSSPARLRVSPVAALSAIICGGLIQRPLTVRRRNRGPESGIWCPSPKGNRYGLAAGQAESKDKLKKWSGRGRRSPGGHTAPRHPAEAAGASTTATACYVTRRGGVTGRLAPRMLVVYDWCGGDGPAGGGRCAGPGGVAGGVRRVVRAGGG